MGKSKKCAIEKQIEHYWVGRRIECMTFAELKRKAFRLSAKGYGVSVIGLSDIEYHVLTITALPEREENGKNMP